ncbi:MFS general substrate transporter [Bimuria novae-zelandiae CBS 107.79]|uniref:MFS general substrate transporter n=1 Tax=Bimuria novae-zelandiae CBS 107.79 TaxID=1447943 RepID=A0A6A5UP63_9PLEO|nr:MFS general substrate transporter [Bimuria novae-zelandiae CBS 107.79]
MAVRNDESLAQETTPLLPRDDNAEQFAAGRKRGAFPALITAFVTSLSFGVTQVPILYIFRVMACDAYYTEHNVRNPPQDRCALRQIESRTAREVAIIGMSTTLFGVANLLVATWCIKKLGVKRALLIQIFWPAVRLAIQNWGAMTGGSRGILIMQASQIITIVGGPNGYVLALNSFITDVVKPNERTGALGQIQGCMMMGSAVGFLVGGLVGDAFGILAPFRMTLLLFLLCCVYVAIALPAIPIEEKDAADAKEKPAGLMRFFGPLRIFAPQKWTLRNGRTSRQYGALMLGIGVFLAILATGYLNTLLQMYATTAFGFGTSANGYLIFMYSSLRGLFLSLAFPRIINFGRRWLQPTSTEPTKIEPETETMGCSPGEIEIADPMDAEIEPLNPPKREDQQENFAFDLLYARCSLLADGILTGLCVFVSEGWQMYIVAALLPLAAGTGSASKGSILQMIPSKDRVDALSGITLVENVARLSTISVFGFVFAALAEIGKTHLIFVCNAGVALVGFIAILFSHFSPEGARRIEG